MKKTVRRRFSALSLCFTVGSVRLAHQQRAAARGTFLTTRSWKGGKTNDASTDSIHCLLRYRQRMT